MHLIQKVLNVAFNIFKVPAEAHDLMERQHNYGKVIDLVNFLEKTSIDDPSQKTVLESMVLHPEDFKTKDTQTHDRGVWSQEFSDMGLPSFLELYLFLTKIAFDILHESMRYHLDHRPKGDPSSMSIKQVQQLNFSSLFLLIISQFNISFLQNYFVSFTFRSVQYF